MEIPTIKTNESIIIVQYNKSDKKKNDSLIKIMKPLIEHKRVTLATFDLTGDICKLLDSGISINTRRIIDCQMVNIPENAKQNYIASTGWQSMSKSIQMLSDTDQPNSDMFQRASLEVESGKKDFPWNVNKFLLKAFRYSEASLLSTEFFTYSANDIFMTSILLVELLITDQFSCAYNATKKKMEDYIQVRESYEHVPDIRDAHHIIENYTVIMQGSYSENERTERLLRRWDEFNTFVQLIEKNNEQINDIFTLKGEDKKTLKAKLNEIEKLIHTKLGKVRALSTLVSLQN